MAYGRVSGGFAFLRNRYPCTRRVGNRGFHICRPYQHMVRINHHELITRARNSPLDARRVFNRGFHRCLPAFIGAVHIIEQGQLCGSRMKTRTTVLLQWVYPSETWNLIAGSIYDKNSVGLSDRPICTRCCFTTTNVIQACRNFVDPEYLS